MTVSEHDRIDQLAVGPDGRLVLAMTEERTYLHDDPATLNDDFRSKINAYLYGIQSGHVRDLAHRSGITNFDGVDIVLFSDAEPTPFVSEVLHSVNREFADKGIRTRWESIAAEELRPKVIELALVEEAARMCGKKWEFALLWVRLIGRDGDAGIKVIRNRRKQETENLEPSELLLTLLGEYKKACYDEQTGTWLSGQISIAGPDDYRADFSRTSDLPWVNQVVSKERLEEELDAFPRAAEEIPDWIPERTSR
ncbi:hypothetical protein [Nocardia sp. BMG111209]|uniref:hypothetical protein n=1 Tax=Nocardia sp. BMG111209 TaxID=1160137 RepID=UPI000374872A|nr:hypothetical protein [Nocardia sp. BMG111209]